MSQRGDDPAYTVFLRFGGQRGVQAGEHLVSRAALQLHVYAVLASIEAGCPGRITDAYLDAVSGETSVAALELCTAGIWTRCHPGTGVAYSVSEDETMRIATEVHRQLEQLSDHCRRGAGHVPDDAHPGLCRKCGVRLDR